MKDVAHLHLVLATARLLHRISQLRIGVALLQLLVDLAHKGRPLHHLVPHLPCLLTLRDLSTLHTTSCHLFYSA